MMLKVALIGEKPNFYGSVDVACLDSTFFNTKDRIEAWKSEDHKYTKLVLVLFHKDPRCPKDMTDIAFLVDGVVLYDDKHTIEEIVIPLWNAWQGKYDILDPKECAGGVSMEEFKETLKQAALPSDDPNKRD